METSLLKKPSPTQWTRALPGGAGQRAAVDRRSKLSRYHCSLSPCDFAPAASYEASLLKAFSKTVDEGRFRVVLADAPLLRASQLRDYWRAGQAAGYEVYVAQPLETDPEVHNPFVLEDHTSSVSYVTFCALGGR